MRLVVTTWVAVVKAGTGMGAGVGYSLGFS